MSSSLELRGRPSGRANNRGGGGRDRGRGNAGGSQHGRSAEPQVAYGRDPADDNILQGQGNSGNFPSSTNPSAQRSHYQSSSNNRGNFGPRRGRMTTPHSRPHLQTSGNQADDNGEMNAHLSEKLIASNRPRDKASTSYSGVPRNPLVEQFERALPFSTDGSAPSAWRTFPDVPSTAELMTPEVDVPINDVENPWDSIDEYLGAHYELLREDSFSPLREAVGRFRKEPSMDDEYQICVYENCRIVGVTFANSSGICIKMSFSINRARKRICWENSKRLCPGTLVALTTDNFEKVARVATVAARPMSGLEGALPYGTVVDLLLHPDELELDPTKTWIMVESRSGYFEAFKHTLRALQRMDTNFPLNKILTLQDTTVGVPQFLKEKPEVNLAPCFSDHDSGALQNVNILQNFPSKNKVTTSMDEFQLEAVERILTKELAIIQGPPGCGKTFVSTKSLAAMIANSKGKDPPIIVACQTNHALDQLLRYVIDFEPRVIRLGGRTQDTGPIRERTLYNIRKELGNINVQGSSIHKCRAKFRSLERKARELIERLSERSLTPDNLLLYGIITQNQRDTFHKFTDQWVKLSTGNKESAISPMVAWIGDALIPIPRREDTHFEFEDEDIGVEELKDLEAEFDDEWDGELRGVFVEFIRKTRVLTRPGVTDEIVQHWIKRDNLWDIPEPLRGDVYTRLERLYISAIETEMRKINQEYALNVAEYKIARWEGDAYILQRARVIGLTTTGISKYRSLVAALQPKICLIEEAAETLEGPLIVACYPSIQQLVLVGDHKQLKGHCNVSELEKPPYNLSISMFERLVNNNVEYTMLKKQRRMRPEIRRILMPIYPDLDDDLQVLNMKPIQGMGSTNLFFFAHEVPEEQDELSKKNSHEAQMIVGFCNYLVENGIMQKEITILTFYTGQARELRRLLFRSDRLNKDAKDRIRVATVDSFQGEENEVVILSLCRSNTQGIIGFLNVPNRVCVSLSRAKRGFYMFGNANLLSQASGLWWDILQITNERTPPAIGTTLPITCQKHKSVTYMQYVSDWHEINGGCKSPCGEYLACGHRCTLTCHPYDHDSVKCADQCRRSLSCGHPCQKKCFETCSSKCIMCNPPNQTQYSTYNPNSHMDRLADRLAGVQTTNSNQPIRGPPPTHYQNQTINKPVERLPEQFPALRSAASSQTAQGPPGLYQNAPFNRPAERLSEPFPNIQTAKSSQTVRGPPPSHYSSIPNKPMERLSEPPPVIQAAPAHQVARKPPTNYQTRNSSKHIEKISERLAEVKTTDMIPTMLNPTSPRKKNAASEAPVRAPEKTAPLISWDTTPSQTTNSTPSIPLVSWDAGVMQLTTPKPQKEVLPSSMIASHTIPDQRTTKESGLETSLLDFDPEVIYSPTLSTSKGTPSVVTLDDRTMQVIVNQDQEQTDVKLPASVDTKASVASAEKIELEKASRSTVHRHESTEDSNLETLKEFVQKQSMEKLGLVKGNVTKKAEKQDPSNKANELVSSTMGDLALINFDDEPATKTLASGGGGVVPFIDMNKVLVPIEKQAYVTTTKKKENFNDDKKKVLNDEKTKENVISEKKESFLELDLLGDLL
ncbi:hypothetical protein TWF225_008077 [Orbilia oligospora]|uniref:Uncharacterized protein n=1 Tax=Orbilia oligospora TaxID=2813651 RepID=A0A7C8KBE9_ORBOL|nr:hypothetical protein TWF751_010588 [Orbilia oligospora]KAF3177804.1 hypothetical protein TWF225_008077 [Orbilia oligospora]KAF3239780.1 hypothetical protein TWF128_011670 [Orbilia oligospora]KAF3247981.1 hypothetical protein TWF217_009442 [Orbilia oligospora]KAF3285754.1 hypothetical protein TWF132_009118 [Orbilia oligospora]